MTTPGAARRRRGALVVCLLLVVATAMVLLSRSIDYTALREAVAAMGWTAPVLSVGLLVALGVVPLPPDFVISLNAVLFGVAAGWGLSAVGLLLGALAGYGVGHLTRPLARHLAGKHLDRIEQRISRGTWWGIAGLRLVPVPFAAVNLALAAFAFPFRRYALLSLPGLALYALPGSLLGAALVGAS